MDFQTLARSLDQVLPNERLFSDVRRYLADFQQGDKYVLVFDYSAMSRQHRAKVVIPVGTKFYAVHKIFGIDFIGEPTSTFRGRVAVGDVSCFENDVIRAKYCFADVSYSADMQLLTINLLQSLLSLKYYPVEQDF